MRKASEQLSLPSSSPTVAAVATAETAGPTGEARAAWERVLGLLQLVVARAGRKEAAWRLDVQPQALSDALAERDRKGVRAEWLPTLLQLADAGEREAILGELAGLVGYEVTPAKVLTPEEELAALKRQVRDTFGRAGEELLARGRR